MKLETRNSKFETGGMRADTATRERGDAGQEKLKTQNAKLETEEAGSAPEPRETRRELWIAAVALGLLSAPAMAQLPGLPAAAPAAADVGGSASAPGAGGAGENDVRPGPVKTETLAPTAVRGSLFGQGAKAMAQTAESDDPDSPARGPAVSFIAVDQPRAKRYKKDDLVTIVVHEDSNSTTGGTGNSKKTQAFDMALQQFLQLALSQSGVPTVGTVNNPSSLPEVKYNYSNDREATAEQIARTRLRRGFRGRWWM